jgi:hypothetical protein
VVTTRELAEPPSVEPLAIPLPETSTAITLMTCWMANVPGIPVMVE